MLNTETGRAGTPSVVVLVFNLAIGNAPFELCLVGGAYDNMIAREDQGIDEDISNERYRI